MKKILLALSIILVMSLAGCGNQKVGKFYVDSETTNSANNEMDQQHVIFKQEKLSGQSECSKDIELVKIDGIYHAATSIDMGEYYKIVVPLQYIVYNNNYDKVLKTYLPGDVINIDSFACISANNTLSWKDVVGELEVPDANIDEIEINLTKILAEDDRVDSMILVGEYLEFNVGYKSSGFNTNPHYYTTLEKDNDYDNEYIVFFLDTDNQMAGIGFKTPQQNGVDASMAIAFPMFTDPSNAKIYKLYGTGTGGFGSVTGFHTGEEMSCDTTYDDNLTNGAMEFLCENRVEYAQGFYDFIMEVANEMNWHALEE